MVCLHLVTHLKKVTSRFFLFCRYFIFMCNFLIGYVCTCIHRLPCSWLWLLRTWVLQTIGSLAQDNANLTYARYVDACRLVYDWTLIFNRYRYLCVSYSNWNADVIQTCYCDDSYTDYDWSQSSLLLVDSDTWSTASWFQEIMTFYKMNPILYSLVS